MVVLACGGTIETAFLPYKIAHFIAHYRVDVHVAMSREARKFATLTAMRAITGHEIYTRNVQFQGPSGTPLHLAWSAPEQLAVYPATARIVAEFAIGSITCPVTRLFAFTEKSKIVVVPQIHQQLHAEVYEKHLQAISDMGCTVLGSASKSADWRQMELLVASRIGVLRHESPEKINLHAIHHTET
jgi:phosphopantothenoylcysteine synthetase/decarboxylase